MVSTNAPRPLNRAVAFAAANLSERDATFSAAQLEREAGDATRGHATHGDVVAAIDRAEHTQAIVIRAAPRMAQGAIGYATREAVATERRMLALESQGRNRFAALHGRVQAAGIIAAAELRAAERDHDWTQGQRDATRALLMSTASVTALQGHAGTAKTSTVLATVADAARDQGLTIRALAPTATAAELLGRAVHAESMTGLGLRDGAQVGAIDETMGRDKSLAIGG